MWKTLLLWAAKKLVAYVVAHPEDLVHVISDVKTVASVDKG